MKCKYCGEEAKYGEFCCKSHRNLWNIKQGNMLDARENLDKYVDL